MRAIDECYPHTFAATKAVEALTYHTPDPMTPGQLEINLRTAHRLTREGSSPLQIYEGLMQLEEIFDAYAPTDAKMKEALALYGKVHAQHRDRLLEARSAYDGAGRALQEVLEETRRRGAALSNDVMFDCIERVDAVIDAAGEGSLFAGKGKVLVAQLEKTWADHVLPGVVPGLPADPSGVSVRRVLAGSLAAGSGLAAADVILQVNGRALTTIDDLQVAVRGVKKGQELALTVRSPGVAGTRELRFALERSTVPLPAKSLEECEFDQEVDPH
jgi:C-terminal processing protease CtpA/Prc